MPRRIGYARSAINDPEVHQQLRELELAGCVRVYADRFVAGDDDRSGWKACLEALDQGDFLVVSRIGRLAATLIELTEVLMSLDERQVELRICHWDPAPNIAPGDLAEIVQRLVEFEGASQGERVRTGLIAARGAGRIGGRRHRLKPEQVKELQVLMAQPGADPIEVGKRFGVGRATVYKYLRKVLD